MGNWLTRLFNKRFNQTNKRIVMVGLDGAGKTTILYKLQLGDVVHTVPTIGFNVEDVEFKGVKFSVWDIGGQHKMRPLWEHYFLNTDGIILVIDSSDTDRIETVAGDETSDSVQFELGLLMDNDQLKGVPLLVFANKQDVPRSMSGDDIIRKLELPTITNRRWFVQESSAIDDEGLYEGLDWLSTVLKSTINKSQ